MSEGEVWRPVPGHPSYDVSSLGSVRKGARLLRPQRNGWGYQFVRFTIEGRQKMFLINRLVCTAFHGPPPDGYHAAHCDGNKSNNAAENLRWASPAENTRDKQRHGTQHRGSANPGAVLDELRVEEVRRLLSSGHAQRWLAAHFGVSQSTISKIARGASWLHVSPRSG